MCLSAAKWSTMDGNQETRLHSGMLGKRAQNNISKAIEHQGGVTGTKKETKVKFPFFQTHFLSFSLH